MLDSVVVDVDDALPNDNDNDDDEDNDNDTDRIDRDDIKRER